MKLAYENRVSLSSNGYYKSPDLTTVTNDNPEGRPFYYFNYAAAVSEVEIDALTGEFTILRSDIVYDAGHSLNPAIDVGQVILGIIHVQMPRIYAATAYCGLINNYWPRLH